MTAIRKHSSPAFKARVVQEALAGERTLVERANRELPLSTQVCLLSVSRSSLYYQPASPSTEEIALKHRIDAIFTEYPFYGSRRITAQLRRERVLINRKAVQRYMREMGLEAIGPVPGSSKRQRGQQVYPYLLPAGSTGWDRSLSRVLQPAPATSVVGLSYSC